MFARDFPIRQARLAIARPGLTDAVLAVTIWTDYERNLQLRGRITDYHGVWIRRNWEVFTLSSSMDLRSGGSRRAHENSRRCWNC
jgi:hypothetical protein